MKGLYSIVGMRYRGTEALVRSMRSGEHLILRRDQTNEHDANAVQVWHGTVQLGFVKGTEVVELAQSMDLAGRRELAGVFAVGADRWPQVEVES